VPELQPQPPNLKHGDNYKNNFAWRVSREKKEKKRNSQQKKGKKGTKAPFLARGGEVIPEKRSATSDRWAIGVSVDKRG